MAKWFQCKCSPDEIMLLTREALSKSLVCREISSERPATIMLSWHCLGGPPPIPPPPAWANLGWKWCSSRCLACCLSTSEALNPKHRNPNEIINLMNKNVGTYTQHSDFRKEEIKVYLGIYTHTYLLYMYIYTYI